MALPPIDGYPVRVKNRIRVLSGSLKAVAREITEDPKHPLRPYVEQWFANKRGR